MASSLWGGKFEKEMDTMVKAYNASIFFDQRMYNEDIDGSIAPSEVRRQIAKERAWFETL